MSSIKYQPAPSPPSNNEPGPGFWEHLKRFWQRVTEGLELSQLWKQFHTDARASYRLYQRDFQARAPRETRKHNFWHTAQEFVWAFLEKLTPPRRVLLLAGVVLLIFPAGGYSYTGRSGQLVILELDPHFWGGILIFLLLTLEIADRVIMKRDLEIARDIQRWLLPATPPLVGGLQIAFATRPANTVAGDFYDVFARPVRNGQPHFLLAVADVAGKSIPAALLMATFQASLKTLSETSCSLAELATAMNHYACTNSQGGLRFTTALLAEYDPASCALTYINAGHNAPILRRNSGAIERLTNGGLPLGIMANATYQSGQVVLQSGDWLVIFTDGLVEAVNSNDQEYDESRVLSVLQGGTTATPDELLRRMMGDLDAFVGATPQHDDVTCMLVKAA
jgi:sigma-B regulation protein RsbU (phosphoserine phosphatase)